MKQIFLRTMLIIASIVTLTACSDEPGTSQLVGTWYSASWNETYTFTKDNHCEYTFGNDPLIKGTYDYDETTKMLTIIFDRGGLQRRYVSVLTNTDLVLLYLDGDTAGSFKRQ